MISQYIVYLIVIYLDILISTFGKRSVAYTRWGKKTCPFDAELVYSGNLSNLKMILNATAVHVFVFKRCNIHVA